MLTPTGFIQIDPPAATNLGEKVGAGSVLQQNPHHFGVAFVQSESQSWAVGLLVTEWKQYQRGISQ